MPMVQAKKAQAKKAVTPKAKKVAAPKTKKAVTPTAKKAVILKTKKVVAPKAKKAAVYQKRGNKASSATTASNSSSSKVLSSFVASQPEIARPHLTTIFQVIAAAAPNLEARIAWNMPCFSHKGEKKVLFSASAFQKYASMFSSVMADIRADPRYKAAFASCDGTRATIHFPYSKAVPTAVVEAIVHESIKRKSSNCASKCAS